MGHRWGITVPRNDPCEKHDSGLYRDGSTIAVREDGCAFQRPCADAYGVHLLVAPAAAQGLPCMMQSSERCYVEMVDNAAGDGISSMRRF